MSSQRIPLYVQVLSKCEPDDAERAKLIETFKAGGVLIDAEMKRRNPTAKRTVMFISNDILIISEKKAKFGSGKEATGNWVYCGKLWYVRNIDTDYHFAQYKTYNTVSRLTEDLWDQEKYDKENNKNARSKS